MTRILLAAILSLTCFFSIQAQYGNEWIDFGKTYYKFKVSEDGIYRISAATLSVAGLDAVPGSQFRLFRLGAEVPMYTSTDGLFTGSDFIEFYGVKNRGELDRALYPNPDAEQLNPSYSMFTDNATYFLTWDSQGQGQRIEGIVNDLSSPPSAEAYYMHKDEWVFSDHAVDPRNLQASTPISYSRYQESEGFGTSDLPSFTLNIPSTQIVASGPPALFEMRLTSSSLTEHDITGLLAGDTILNHATQGNFQFYHVKDTIPANDIDANQELAIADARVNGRFVVSSIEWAYPRQYNFLGRNTAHFVHPALGSAQYFELAGFSHGGEDPVIYDRSSGVRLIGERSGTTLRFLLPAFTGERDIVVASEQDAVYDILSLEERTFQDYSQDNTEYIIITHPSMRTGDDIVGQYAQYRRTTGAAYNVNIYDIIDLYDQFGYGIEKHPQAIRNFGKLIVDQWDAAKMVLLIGKGLTYTLSRDAGDDALLLVPTYGQPGADHLLFTENGISQPPFPVGRIPATTQDQVQVYLSKVQEYEQVKALPQTLEAKGWTKEILHLGGGKEDTEQLDILDYLQEMDDIVSTAPFGGHVTTFSKRSTSATVQSVSDKIIEILQHGTSIVKFFGHSSANTLDFQINNPRDWGNHGKYPIFSAMGCKAGDIHQQFVSLSESFVFEPDAGSIAFIAGSGSQYLNTLGNWGVDWYADFGNNADNKTLGETVRESLAQINQFGSIGGVLLIEQQTIAGDPALPFHSSPGPDYVWDFESVSHQPEILTTNENTFILKADVVNLGSSYADTVMAYVAQRLPDGSEKQVFLDTVYLKGFRTTLEFEIPMDINSSGLNTFYLTIDALDSTEELPSPSAESNNELADASGEKGIDIFILDNRAKATSPLEFSIVTSNGVELVASSTNAFIKGARFVMEMDTTPDFNSALKQRERFDGFGGVLRWNPPFNFVPGTVYYWRISTDNEAGEYLWDTSSFLYNPGGQRGWNQSHYGQFQKDVLKDLDFYQKTRIDFDTLYRNIWVQNKVDSDPSTLDDDPVVYINNRLRRDFFTNYQSFEAHVYVMAIDSFSGRFLTNAPGGSYGAVNPLNSNLLIFPFNTHSQEGRNSLMTFLTDVVSEGMYVILATYQRPGHMEYAPESWAADEQSLGRSIYSVIESAAPGSNIRSLETSGSIPYLLYYRKGSGMIYEGIAQQLEETISYDYNFVSRATTGSMQSTLIGPAKLWKSFEWDFSFSDNPSQDIMTAELLALSKDLSDTLRLNVTTVSDTLLDFIDAGQYPYVLLNFNVSDVPNLTAPYVNHWRILYEGVPDLLIDPAGGFDFEGDSLMIGQPLTLTTNIENLGADLTDPFLVRFVITDASNNTITAIEEVPPLMSGESALIHTSHEMTYGEGQSSIYVELNPYHTVEESSYLNNTGILNFVLLADRNNPILDVTFDGRHLVDGDVVSAQPAIVATLHDDNPFRLLDDRTAFEVFLAYPNAFEYTELDINAPEFTFEPALSSQSNSAKLIFKPTLEDGFYELLIRAHDRTNNEAGSLDYAVSFEVLGDRLLSRVDADPRWFNDHTRFTFTLSGSDLPSEINLEIINVSGQVVRNIGKDEIGLFVGTTEYLWDGTTDSGERLPGGVYFYRLRAKDANGNEYDYLGPGFQALKNARVGKVVIVR